MGQCCGPQTSSEPGDHTDRISHTERYGRDRSERQREPPGVPARSPMTNANAVAATTASIQSTSSLRRPRVTHTRTTSRSGHSTSAAYERSHTSVHAPVRSPSRLVMLVSTLVGPGAGHHRTTRSRTDNASIMTSVGRRLREASTTDENIRIRGGRQRPDDMPWAWLPLTIPPSIRNLTKWPLALGHYLLDAPFGDVGTLDASPR